MPVAYDHVTLRVTDLDRSIQFYRETLGVEPTSRRMLSDNVTEQAVYRVGDLVLVMFRRPEFQRVAPDASGGLDHLAFNLDGETYESVLARLRDRGLILRGPQQNQGAHGLGLATYFLDPDGIEIEIKTYDPAVMERYP